MNSIDCVPLDCTPIILSPGLIAPPPPFQDLRGLSGGERSYTTIAFLLALGHSTESPFRVMDEFDVFMVGWGWKGWEGWGAALTNFW